MTVTAFLLALGAVARITRFINSDTLVEPVRRKVLRRYGPESWWYTLITCPWCMSVWVAAAVTPLAWIGARSPVFLLPAMALSMSYLYAIVTMHLDGDE